MDGVVNSNMYGNGGCSSSSYILESLWVPNSSPSINERSMINFEEEDVSSETEGDRNSQRRPEKKRRLTIEQVRELEKSFEMETKLEPQRKDRLANELGLQSRQVAIWFQNRRARFKTKQIEKEYDSLKSNYESLKVDFDSLLKEKQRLQNQVSTLTSKLNQRGETGSTDPVQLDQCEAEPVVEPACKQETVSSAKSDMSDNSASPHCTEKNSTSSVEVKPEFSPEMEEYGFGDVFEVHGSCNLGMPSGVDDNSSNYWSWLY